MTIIDALKSKIEIEDSKAVDKLTFVGLNPYDIWDNEDQAQKCKLYKVIIETIKWENVGIRAIQEGGYRVDYELGEKDNFIKHLAHESGCDSLIALYDPRPKIRNKSYLW